jgi:hypothetical protein
MLVNLGSVISTAVLMPCLQYYCHIRLNFFSNCKISTILPLALILTNLNDTQGIHKKLQHYISQLPPEVQPKPSISGRQPTQMSGIGAVLA